MKEVTQGTADVKTHTRRVNRNYQPKPISDFLDDFDVERMDTGTKRGMVLKLWKAKLTEIIDGGRTGNPPESPFSKGDDSRLKSLLTDIRSAELLPKNGAGYANPVLVITMAPGSMWRTELQWYRLTLKKLINRRLKCEFLKDVRIQ